MKKTITTIAILIALTIGATAQPTGGGLFMRGEVTESVRNGNGNDISPMLPYAHNLGGDQDASDSPLSGGLALLFSLGVMYLTAKRRKE